MSTVESTLHVVLVHPEIHWNTGNAGRTCLAAGAQLHLVRPLGFSLDDREVQRAGLDYWERVEPVVWLDWADLEAALPTLGEPFFFSAEAARSLWDVTFPTRAVLVFGRESVGLPAALRARHADRLVRIPMSTAALRSLNLSTAVADRGLRGPPPAPPALTPKCYPSRLWRCPGSDPGPRSAFPCLYAASSTTRPSCIWTTRRVREAIAGSWVITTRVWPFCQSSSKRSMMSLARAWSRGCRSARRPG